MLKFSARAREDGALLTRRGGKWIRCGTTFHPMGVYQAARRTCLLLEDGTTIHVESPAGIALNGYAVAAMRTR